MNSYEKKKQERLERTRALAEKNRERSQQAYETSNKLVEHIPLGQPILVGHHSEKRHRRHMAKVERAMDKGVEFSKKAAYYAGKAASIENNTAISSDDPDAIEKIQEKIDKLTKECETFKAINKIVRGKGTKDEKIIKLGELDIKPNTAKLVLSPDNIGGPGIPAFTISTKRAEIRRLQTRIKNLESIGSIPDAEITLECATIEVSGQTNRVKIFFDSSPSSEKIKELRSYGFKWAPSDKSWRRTLSQYSIQLAKTICNG